MGTTSKQLRRVDGGISRRGEPALSEAAALGRAATPWRAVDALNMESVNDLLATRNGCGPSLVDDNDLGVVLWISGWSPWNYGGGGTGGGSYDNDSIDDKWQYIIENGKVTRGSGTRVIRPPVNRWTTSAFSITAPANQILNVDPSVALNIQWTQYKTGKGGYKIQIKDLDTGAEVYVKPDWPIEGFDLPANTLALSKQYTIKVWAITRRDAKGKPSGWVSATNTRTFTTRLTTPTNLAPTGTIATLTPTMTCDAVVKAVRYKVKIYDAAGTTLLHTSIPLLLPSYPLGAGVLTNYQERKWTFTAYPDAVCTEEYGVTSEPVSYTPQATSDYLKNKTIRMTLYNAPSPSVDSPTVVYTIALDSHPEGQATTYVNTITGSRPTICGFSINTYTGLAAVTLLYNLGSGYEAWFNDIVPPTEEMVIAGNRMTFEVLP
jgi:hypothetical protein